MYKSKFFNAEEYKYSFTLFCHINDIKNIIFTNLGISKPLLQKLGFNKDDAQL